MSTPSEADLRRYLDVANQACDAAAVVLDSHFGNLRKLEEKFQAGLVSDADRESEIAIVSILRKTFPDHSVLGEEFGTSGTDTTDARFVWMIDPLDGTTNYVHQFPFFATSIGLEVDGELVVGVVNAPKLGLRFTGAKGLGSFVNGERLKVSTRSVMNDGLFATGFSSYDNTLDEQLELLATIVKHSRGIRRAGAAALDLCMVAQGIFDVYWEKNLSPWDTAAGVVIAREAGAIVTDMRGQSFDPRMKSLLCGNPPLHAETMKFMLEIAKRKGR
jgi:myo-inositol-1(or 4)-monophosphatase